MTVYDIVLDKIRKTVLENELIKNGDLVLVGLSGGADSVCLTYALKALSDEMGFHLHAAHLEHGIRGKEALRDADFAKKFSHDTGVECTIRHENVPEYAKTRGISEELAGREIRYAFFDALAKELGCTKIATAHNRNDNAETLAMNFIRGASTGGLCGIPYRRGIVIRPLLNVSRGEVEAFCEECGLSYVTDSTNGENDYTRNRVRHFLLPMIEVFNPNFINTVSKNARLISADEDYLSDTAAKIYEKCTDNSIETALLCGLHDAIGSRVIRLMIANAADGLNDISAERTDDVRQLAEGGKSGASLNLPNGVTARIEYGRLIIERAQKAREYEYTLPVGGEVFIREYGITLCAQKASERANDGAQYFSGGGCDDIKIRSRKSGDFFYPAGMGGKKKVKDYFINEKIPRAERARIPIVTFGGEIGWIVGYRRDERFAFNGKGIRITVK